MTEPHGINGILMVLGVLLGIALLFFGYRLERYIGYVRATGAMGWLLTAVFLCIASPQQLLSALQGSLGFSALARLVMDSPNALHVWLKVASIVLAIVWGALAHRFFPRISESLSMLIVYAWLFALVFITGWAAFSLTALPIAALILCIVISGFRVFYTKLFRALESAMIGSLLISWLFTRFYYLPLWIFILLLVILGVSGGFTQILFLRKKIKDQNVMSGKEPA
jgi:hypothetical protein